MLSIWSAAVRTLVVGAALVVSAPAHAQQGGRAVATLTNPYIRAEFDDRGLAILTDRAHSRAYHFNADAFRVAIDGTSIASGSLPAAVRRTESNRVTYSWSSGPYQLQLAYELQPGWRFLSKRLLVSSARDTFTIHDVTLLQSTLAERPADVRIANPGRARLQTSEYGVALRFADGNGLLLTAQNPFLHFRREDRTLTLQYAPEMGWRSSYGPFASDRALLAPYRLSGRSLPAQMTAEWRMAASDTSAGLDEAEVATFTNLVRSFLLSQPARPTNVFVGWCANDYQIDVATAEGRAEYKRLIDRAAELGADYVLYAPSNSALSRREESIDDWSWEHVLWLGLGQKIRRGEWNVRTSPVPPSVQEMLTYAQSRNVKLLAYVYPVLPFLDNAEWLAAPRRANDRPRASLAIRSFQDWLIQALVDFHRHTGIGGYAFDHTFLSFEGSSRYAQWYGWRRVMEELRRRIPDLVIDGRQAYHLYGPWSWLAGTYPHPTFNDEQPESFVPFPDLHFDRVSADRERYTAFLYRNYEFAPSEIVPGFITHQTSRSADNDDMPFVRTPDRGVVLTRFRARDWDYLGWRYSLLSSIAVGGWNNIINMIPARDTAEFENFSDADIEWFRSWIDWTRAHKKFLRHTRTILGQPAIGKIDGTSAFLADSGYIFLFNPNARRLTAHVPLDESIGLQARAPLQIRELHPRAGRRLSHGAQPSWRSGDDLAITLDGGTAAVLEVRPAARVQAPRLLNAAGRARMSGRTLRIDSVRGEPGTTDTLLVAFTDAGAISTVLVNDVVLPFTRVDASTLSVPVSFAGVRFGKYQQVGRYDAAFTGGTVSARFSVPKRVFAQLQKRQAQWPIPWTPSDFQTTWLAPARLLLFVQIAEPNDRMDVKLKVDGRIVELRKAYSAVRAVPSTFVGFYADVSLLEPDREYQLELTLPPLKPGQFQGIFFENVEPEYTSEVVSVRN